MREFETPTILLKRPDRLLELVLVLDAVDEAAVELLVADEEAKDAAVTLATFSTTAAVEATAATALLALEATPSAYAAAKSTPL